MSKKVFTNFAVKTSIILLTFFLLINLSDRCANNRRNIEMQQMLAQANDSLKIWRDVNNKQNALIKVIQGENTDMFVKLKHSDSVVNQLQQLVNKYSEQLSKQGSATIIHTQTKFDTILLPMYNSGTRYYKHKDKWIDFQVQIDSNNVGKFDLAINNRFDILTYYKREKWYKNKQMYIQVISDNIYTDTKALKSFEVKNRMPKISIGPQLGIGINNQLQITPYIGIGTQLNLLNF